MVTAAAIAHVNRLPVLFLPATSSPTARPTRCCSRSRTSTTARVSANDCFKPVTRYFDRIVAPEHLLTALPRALPR